METKKKHFIRTLQRLLSLKVKITIEELTAIVDNALAQTSTIIRTGKPKKDDVFNPNDLQTGMRVIFDGQFGVIFNTSVIVQRVLKEVPMSEMGLVCYGIIVTPDGARVLDENSLTLISEVYDMPTIHEMNNGYNKGKLLWKKKV